MVEPPKAVRQYFTDAGWYAGRSVPVSADLPRDHPAWTILSTFGGLRIIERPSDPEWDPMVMLAFRPFHFPQPTFQKTWSRLLGCPLVSIADVDNSHGELFLADDGRCFGESCVHDAFWFYGESFSAVIEGILLGRLSPSRPMLRPDQEYVKMRGEYFTQDSPELYRYD